MRIIYDRTIHKECEIPEKMERFLEEIKMICKKYNLSISHEDGHGCFLIEEYNERNVEWLFDARKNYKDSR